MSLQTRLEALVAAIGADIKSLKNRATALETVDPKNISSAVVETAASNSIDYTYQTISITLTPGTWRVDGWGSLASVGANNDTKALALWNDTTGLEVANSRSGAGAASATGIAVSFYTSAVMVVTANTVIKLRGLRNGGSTLAFGVSGVALVPQRLMAHRLA